MLLPRPVFFLLPLLACACTNRSLTPADTLVVELEGPTQTINPLYTMDTNGTHMTKIVSDQPGVFFSDWGTST